MERPFILLLDKSFEFNVQKKELCTYPTLSRQCLPSAFTGTGDGCTKGGRPKREAIKEQWAAYLQLSMKRVTLKKKNGYILI
jgi:hypothetical protein